MARRKAVDPFDELLKSRYSPVGQFRPMCGYLHADGTVSQYATEAMAWYSFDRAISTCFGSAAKRLRGLHQIGANHSPIVAILMLVMSGDRVAWKHRFDIPENP